MNRFFTKSIALIALVGAFTVFSTNKAEAAFTLEICNDVACAGGDDLSYTDGALLDPLDGVLGVFTTFNGMEVILTGAISKPVLASGMDLVFSVANSVGGADADIYIRTTDTGFAGLGLLAASIGGTSDASVVVGTVCQVAGGCFGSGPLVGNPYSKAWLVGPAGSDPYEMSMQVSVVGLKAGKTASGDFRVVPEPVSLALFGLGLAGLAARRRRKA